MTELSTEAKAILEAGQSGLSPSAATKASVLHAVESNIAGAASASSLGAGSATGVASLKLVLGLVLAVGVGGGIWLARATNSANTSSESTSISANALVSEAQPIRTTVSDNGRHNKEAKALALVPEQEKPTDTDLPPTEAAASEFASDKESAVLAVKQTVAAESLLNSPKNSVQAHRNTKPATKAVRSTLAEEQKLIAAAQVAIRKTDYTEALRLLNSHNSQFPKGILAPERKAASAIAGCLSERSGSKAAGRRFLASHARSPLAGRVRSSCKLP